MKENKNYLEPQHRKKILLLSDDLRHFSGIATVSREMVMNTAHHFNWIQLGAALSHPEVGKIFDVSESVNQEMNMSDADVKIIPNNGYGDMQTVRNIIRSERPDALMIFTDPRYWIWLFRSEREIRSQIPIIYLNIWDNLPYPMWNKSYYESCDGLFAISKQTYNINKVVLGNKADKKVIRYIPHGVSSKYFPIVEESEEYLKFKNNLRGEKEFVLLYNARNLGRKRVADLILAWRHFCDIIGKEKAKQCRLVLHTEVVDNAGTDLMACAEAYCDPSYIDILFDTHRYPVEYMNYLYNSCDGTILVSSAEGWGLSLTESMMCGKMIIATVTGGMQDQMRFEDEEGKWIDFSLKFPTNHTLRYKNCGEWAIPVSAANGRSVVGSVTTPYIYDDRASIESISEAILKLYNLSPEEKRRKGLLGREWAMSREAGFTSKIMGERIIEGIDTVLDNFRSNPVPRYDLVEALEGTTYIDYDPINYQNNE